MSDPKSAPPAPLPSPSATPEARAEQRRLTRYSLLSGLTPLFPVPIVDDWLRDGLREKAVATLLAGRGIALDPPAIRLLARGEEPPGEGGCAGCLGTAVVWPLRLLFRIVIKGLLRKLIFVLTIKDCASELSSTYHLGHLLRHAAATGAFAVPPEERPARVLAIRKAIETALAAMGFTPLDPWVRIAFRRSWRIIASTAAGMSDFLRRAPVRQPPEPAAGRPSEQGQDAVYRELEQEAATELDPLAEELEAELAGEQAYLRSIENAFDNALKA